MAARMRQRGRLDDRMEDQVQHRSYLPRCPIVQSTFKLVAGVPLWFAFALPVLDAPTAAPNRLELGVSHAATATAIAGPAAAMAGHSVRRLLPLVACLLLGWVATCAEVPQQSGASLGRRFGGGTRAGSGATVAAPGGLALHGRRYPVRLRYTACTGLVNQQYSHIAAFTLAAALGVHEVLLPPAAVRDSFGHVFSIHQSENQMQWFPARPSCLLDVARLQRTWADLGLTVTEVGGCLLPCGLTACACGGCESVGGTRCGVPSSVWSHSGRNAVSAGPLLPGVLC